MAKQLGALRFRGKLANVVGYKNTSGASNTNTNFVRERVYEISNPQTYAQSAQRAKVKPAQLFYMAFEPVLNHAFLPTAKASRNRNRFMSLALRNGVPGLLRGESTLPLFPYQISEGSLGLDRYAVGAAAADSIVFPISVEDGVEGASIGAISRAILENNVGFVRGEELTFLVIAGNGDFNARYAQHFSFILNPDDEINGTEQILPVGISLSAAGGQLSVSGVDGVVLYAAGLIISSKTTSSYIYSKSFMCLTETAVELSISENSAILSYMKGSSDHSSDLILQQANNAQAGNVVVPVSYEENPLGDPETSVVVVVMSDGSQRLLLLEGGSLAKLVGQTIVSAGVTPAAIGLAGSPTISLAELQRYVTLSASSSRAIAGVLLDGRISIAVGTTDSYTTSPVTINISDVALQSAVRATQNGQPVTLSWNGDEATFTPSEGTIVISDNEGIWCTLTFIDRP